MNTAIGCMQCCNAKTKLENGFDLSDYDLRALDFAKEYSLKLLSIDVNINVTQMLERAWELFVNILVRKSQHP